MSEEEYRRRKAEFEQRRRRRKRRIRAKRIFCLLLTAAAITGMALSVNRCHGETGGGKNSKTSVAQKLKAIEIPEFTDTQLIHRHSTARTGKELDGIHDIVIHYVGNPGTTAQNNRDYFDKSETEVSSHFVVGLEGEIIQCLPLWERSAASNDRNHDTISIEVCHPDKSGKFSDKTYAAVVKLTAWLLKEIGLTEENVIRHYDVTGKLCPLYYAENPDEWECFKKDVRKALDEA